MLLYSDKVDDLELSLNAPATIKPNLERIGVALGGGSARGYAHIGALDVLERHNLHPSVIAGTSFGASYWRTVRDGSQSSKNDRGR